MEILQIVTSSLGIVGTIIGLWYAGSQLRASRLSARGTFLLNLDEAFLRHLDVYSRLERIEVLIEGGVLNTHLTNRLYGYRVRNIVANERIRTKLLVEGAAGWQDFLSLVSRLKQDGRVFPSLP
jgi:hypothetical protein